MLRNSQLKRDSPMHTVSGPAPGFHRHPEHRIAIRDSEDRWQVRSGDIVLAETQAARILEETGYGDVVYFPPGDVFYNRLAMSETETTCPFKGRADYFRLASGADRSDVAWTYPATYEEAEAIAGYVAFYANKISIQKLDSS